MENRYEINENSFQVVGADASDAEAIQRPGLSFWQDAWRRFRKNPVAMAGLIIICVISLFCILAPILSPYEYSSMDYSASNEGMSRAHLFGTDQVGRDYWTRVWSGGRISLLVGVMGAIFPCVVGIIIGGISGYFGGKIDMVIMRIIDIGMCIPSMIYLILIIIYLGAGPMPIVFAFGLTAWMSVARNVRGLILSLKEREFVLAARALGASSLRIIFVHLLPNILGFIIIGIANIIPAVIFAEASMSYIGLGIQMPMTSWGQLCNEATALIRVSPHRLFIPAILISLTMLSFTLIGDGLRDALDPTLRNQR